MADAVATPKAVHHVRLTVTDLARSRDFYESVLGLEVAAESPGDVSDPAVREDPAQLYGGVVYKLGDQLLGLRPVAASGDSFVSTRVGLDHISLLVDSRDALDAAQAALESRGITHGKVMDLDMGIAILSFQDPDDINLELVTPLS